MSGTIYLFPDLKSGIVAPDGAMYDDAYSDLREQLNDWFANPKGRLLILKDKWRVEVIRAQPEVPVKDRWIAKSDVFIQKGDRLKVDAPGKSEIEIGFDPR